MLFDESAISVIRKVLQTEDFEQGRRKREANGEVKAYVFGNQHSSVRFYQVNDLITIEEVERLNSPPYMRWTGVLDEQKCFQECLTTWNVFGDKRHCRFMVVRNDPPKNEVNY